MPIKQTTQEFLDRLTKIGTPIILDPPNQIYQSLEYELTFRCDSGHLFSTKPRYLLHKKSGCPICGKQRASQKNTISHYEFIVRLNERNKKYPIILLKQNETYKGTYTKIKFLCEQGHEFSTFPKTIIRGSGCPHCKVTQNVINHTYGVEQFVEMLSKRNQQLPHKRVYLIDPTHYTKTKALTWFVCDNGHSWLSQPTGIIHKFAGCPICAASKTYSDVAIKWLDQIAANKQLMIKHIRNSGKEFVIPGTKFKADGFCESTNTVYEFYGDYWHGNPHKFKSTDINEVVGKSFGELYRTTIERENLIKQLGYNLESVWESDFELDENTKIFSATE